MVPFAIALGINVGHPQCNLRLALAALHRSPDLTLVAQSSLYQTIAICISQPDILNARALVQTTLSPSELLRLLLGIEQDFDRVRQERWGPRTLDLDLLFYDQAIITEPNLQVPHPRLRERAFVLVPLAEIAPHWLDPVSGRSVQDLCNAVDPVGVTLLGEIAAQI